MELELTPSLQFHPLKSVCLWKIDFHIVVTVSACVDVVRRSLLSYCWCWHWVCGVVSWLYSEKSVDVNMFSTSSWHQVIRVWLLFQGTGEHAFGCCHFCFSCCYHYIYCCCCNCCCCSCFAHTMMFNCYSTLLSWQVLLLVLLLWKVCKECHLCEGGRLGENYATPPSDFLCLSWSQASQLHTAEAQAIPYCTLHRQASPHCSTVKPLHTAQSSQSTAHCTVKSSQSTAHSSQASAQC